MGAKYPRSLHTGNCSFAPERSDNCSFAPETGVGAIICGFLFVALLGAGCDKAGPPPEKEVPTIVRAVETEKVPERPWFEGEWQSEVELSVQAPPTSESVPPQVEASPLKGRLHVRVSEDRRVTGELISADSSQTWQGFGILDDTTVRFDLVSDSEREAWIRGSLVAVGGPQGMDGTLRLSRVVQEQRSVSRVSYAGQVRLAKAR